MIENYNVLFYLPKEKELKNGKTPIYCRITLNGKRATFSIGKHLNDTYQNSYNYG
jgi:hypothetical protein